MRALLAAATVLLSSAADAAPMRIDDFGVAQTTIDTTSDGAAASTTASWPTAHSRFTRTLSVNQTQHGDADLSPESRARIGSGSLQLSNDGEANAEVGLTYDIDPVLDDLGSASPWLASVTFDGISGQAPFTVGVFVNDTAIGSQSFAGPGVHSFTISEFAASGNRLRLMFNGGTAFGATIGPIMIDSGGGGGLPVPEPDMLGLLALGFGAAALGWRRAT